MKFLFLCLFWLVLVAVFWPVVLATLILLPLLAVIASPFALLALRVAGAFALVS
jgi:hypothetical protein